MKSRFDNPRAFAPFFDTYARITGVRAVGGTTRTVDGTFSICFLDDGYADTVAEDATASNVREATIYVARKAPKEDDERKELVVWNDETPPKRGDQVHVLNGGTFRVVDVDATDKLQYTLTVREVAAA